MIPGGTELVVIAVVLAVLVAGPKLIPLVVERGAATLEETRAAVEGATGGAEGDGPEGGR